MASIAKFVRRLVHRSPEPPRRFPSQGFRVLESSKLIEEEKFPWYDPTKLYPASIGEVFQSRYQIVGKLGYGAYSTVWLCRDLEARSYVTLKVCERDASGADTELSIYNRLNKTVTKHVRSRLVRKLIDKFDVPTSHGFSQCLVHEPLGMSFFDLRKASPSRKFPEDLLRPALQHILLALDFLHNEAGIIHTDIKQSNILLGVEDNDILEDFEKEEFNNPTPRKLCADRTIYESRKLKIPKTPGRPIICDFGQARFGNSEHTADIQPYAYRAPEVILRLPWNSKVDIWNVGVMIWHLFEDKNMFLTQDENGDDSSAHHLAQMIAFLGEPPLRLLQRGKRSSEFFDNNGKWKDATPIPNISLESSEENLEGTNKADFLRFMRSMLQWEPDNRNTARELLEDPWLSC